MWRSNGRSIFFRALVTLQNNIDLEKENNAS